MVGLIVLSPRLVRHLATAVGRHLRVLRADGICPPPELLELANMLVDALAAENGPQWTDFVPAQPVSDAELVSYEVAGQRLGVSARTIRRMVAGGRLPVVAAGRRRLVPVAALREFAAGER